MRRFTLGVCGAAAALAVLTACGGTTTKGVAEPAVHTVSDLAKLMVKQTQHTHTAHFRLDLAAGHEQVKTTGQVDFAGTDTKMSMHGGVSGVGTLDMVVIGDTAYLKLPEQMAATGKPWVKFDSSGTDPVSRALSGLLSEEKQNVDPSQSLSQLVGSATITRRSQDTVNGQPATRYDISVDTQKMLHSKLVTPQLRQLLATSGASLPPHFTEVMWLNSDNLPVKFTLTEKVAGQQVHVTATYTDWGGPVDITAPPADQIGPLPTH